MESVKSINKSASSSGHTTEQKPVYDFLKRIFDIICSSAALIILSPVFLILAAAIKTTDKGPVFFTHMHAEGQWKFAISKTALSALT